MQISHLLTLTILAAAALLTASLAAAQVETVLHNFDSNGKDGTYPLAGLIMDTSGNHYGTTAEGGAHGFGMVFELSPKSGGGMTEKILHSFNFNGIDGTYPYATLIFDASGNLYGTTSSGGAGTCGTNGCGTVFELLPQSGGAWTERILTASRTTASTASAHWLAWCSTRLAISMARPRAAAPSN